MHHKNPTQLNKYPKLKEVNSNEFKRYKDISKPLINGCCLCCWFFFLSCTIPLTRMLNSRRNQSNGKSNVYAWLLVLSFQFLNQLVLLIAVCMYAAHTRRLIFLKSIHFCLFIYFFRSFRGSTIVFSLLTSLEKNSIEISRQISNCISYAIEIVRCVKSISIKMHLTYM